MRTPRIFISMGTPYTDAYLKFRDSLEEFLRDQCGCDPRIINKNEYPTGSPVDKIAEVIRSCDGVIIVAYERTYLQAGVERRGGAEPAQLEKKTYTTPWNHIESAMAYSYGLPIHMLAQTGLKEEGLIETKSDWYVQKIDLTPESLRDPHVTGSIKAWVEQKVKKHRSRRRGALEGFAALRFSEFTMEDWGLLRALTAAAFSAGAAAAHWLHL